MMSTRHIRGGGYPGRGISLEIVCLGACHDEADEGREANGVARLTMCIPLGHTRGGGYPGSATTFEILCLRACRDI